jgi:flavodoxin
MSGEDDLLVLFGSQTGNAEEIARALASDLEDIDLDVGIMSMQSWIEANNVKKNYSIFNLC